MRGCFSTAFPQLLPVPQKYATPVKTPALAHVTQHARRHLPCCIYAYAFSRPSPETCRRTKPSLQGGARGITRCRRAFAGRLDLARRGRGFRRYRSSESGSLLRVDRAACEAKRLLHTTEGPANYIRASRGASRPRASVARWQSAGALGARFSCASAEPTPIG